MIMKLKRKLLLLTMILTCLCFLATGCNQEEKDTAAPTETKVEEPINEDTADADITKEEAQAFFEEITDSVYYHLLEIPVDDLQTGIQPYYWIWIAAPEQEAVLDDFTEPYITQEDQYIPQRRRPAVLRGIFQKRCPGRPGSHLGNGNRHLGRSRGTARTPHDY